MFADILKSTKRILIIGKYLNWAMHDELSGTLSKLMRRTTTKSLFRRTQGRVNSIALT